jgi:DNA invertase Pin-like site-specific DNA recombinase
MKGQNVGYIRVSTVEQNIVRQLDGIELDKLFTDTCSGSDINRPQLSLMLNHIREGDTVYVHSMDRLARNLDDLRKLVNQVTAQKVKIQFIKESITFTGEDSPMSNLLLSVMGAFAEFERALIKERQKEGIAIAKKEQKYLGRSKQLTSEQIVELRQMINDRYSKIEIAKKFGIHRTTLYQYLK